MWPGMWVTSRTGSVGWDLRKALVEFCRREKKVDFRLLAEALRRVRTWWGADGKVSIERLCLSPYVEKPFNSKVIKKFRTWTKKSSTVFRVSGFLCYLCALWTLWTFCVPVWICTFHISISWYVTSSSLVTVPQRLGKGTGRVGNRRMNGDHPNNSIVKIGQNIEKSPGDPRRITVAQTPVKDH